MNQLNAVITHLPAAEAEQDLRALRELAPDSRFVACYTGPRAEFENLEDAILIGRGELSEGAVLLRASAEMGLYERALELAPGDETSFRNLVRLLIEADNHARAQSVARTFIEYLAAELGVAPSAESTRLLRELPALRNDEPIVVVAPRAARDRHP